MSSNYNVEDFYSVGAAIAKLRSRRNWCSLPEGHARLSHHRSADLLRRRAGLTATCTDVSDRYAAASPFIALTVNTLVVNLWSCFYHIRALRHIRPNLTLNCAKNIACSLVGCGLDYANSTLVGSLFLSRLRIFFGFNVCKSCSLVLSHVNGDASASPTLCRSFIGFLSSGT